MPSEDQREKARARFRAWYAKHRAEVAEKRKASRAEHPDKPLTAAQKKRRAARKRAWYAANRERIAMQRKGWMSESPDARELYGTISYERRLERLKTDPELYARLRKASRDYLKRRVDKARKRAFAERPAGRIPDTMTKADVERCVARSRFIANNQTASEMAANRDFHNNQYRERWGIE